LTWLGSTSSFEEFKWHVFEMLGSARIIRGMLRFVRIEVNQPLYINDKRNRFGCDLFFGFF
jgi:hypothetical protein